MSAVILKHGYCVGDTVYQVMRDLQKKLDDIAILCRKNSLSIYSYKTEIMVINSMHVWVSEKAMKINKRVNV